MMHPFSILFISAQLVWQSAHRLRRAPADEVNAIVLDVGTYQAKAGYGGEDTPKFVIPSVSE